MKPLPIISSIYFHKNCIISTNSATKNESKYGPTKLLATSPSIFFNIVSQYDYVYITVKLMTMSLNKNIYLSLENRIKTYKKIKAKPRLRFGSNSYYYNFKFCTRFLFILPSTTYCESKMYS